jgi:hypothetical protein
MTDFTEMAQKFAKPTSGKTGGYLSKLNTEEQAEIERFGAWLKTTGDMTDASIASYRSYLAAAMVAFNTGKARGDLTSSQKSAVNRYLEFLEKLGAPASE